jgi:hypothetical protein
MFQFNKLQLFLSRILHNLRFTNAFHIIAPAKVITFLLKNQTALFCQVFLKSIGIYHLILTFFI